MKRRWKVLGGLFVVLAVLLAINTVTTGNQTKEAEVTVDGGEILNLSGGDIQVTDSGDPSGNGQPIVLLHGYSNSLRWFDAIEPMLAQNHRVIRVDLLGHGGSEKPESGYSIVEQARLVAEAMNELGVQGALVAGNSMGGVVATSLAEQASQLVDRVVLIDIAPDTENFGDGLPFLAKLGYTPVLGEAMWRVSPDFAVKSQIKKAAFAPGFDPDGSFDEGEDQLVDDFRAMTYTSYDEAPAETDDYTGELPLDERYKQTPVPLLVMFGAEDQLFDVDEAVEGYSDVPGVRSEVVQDAGHAPQVEQPDQVADLIESFSVSLEPVATPNPEKPKKKKSRKKN